MLKALSIENIAVAKKLNIDFEDGFSVFTGKTGAGKSVMMESIALLLGGKAQKELVRHGESIATVSALFDGEPDKFPFDENGEAYVTRTVTAEGKSGARINGKSVPLTQLREAAGELLSLHSQNETATLYDRAKHILLLDRYAEIEDEVAEYAEVYHRLVAKKSEIAELKKSLEDKNMMTDILKYQVSEIDKAKITDPAEEEKLEKLRTKLKSLEAITKNANLVYKALSPGEKGASAAYLLERAAASLRTLSEVMEGAEEMADRLDEYRIEVIDIAEQARELVDIEDGVDPKKKLDMVESRLQTFRRIKKKYGGDLAAVLEFRETAAKKLRDLQSGDERVEELESEYRAICREAMTLGTKLSEKRREAGIRLGVEVMETLKFLDMPKVRFFAEIHSTGKGDDKFNSRGIDTVDFTVVTNPGEEPQSMAKIASGGEMSRIMLALKCAEAAKAGADTVIFDEIDTGVSGGTSERIGIKLSQLSRGCQVICVTHSAQVASHGDHHFLIEKNEVDGRAESSVRIIEGEERISEIARIIGGINITEKQIKAAVEMLENNKNI